MPIFVSTVRFSSQRARSRSTNPTLEAAKESSGTGWVITFIVITLVIHHLMNIERQFGWVHRFVFLHTVRTNN
jgi:hypothetical protein